MEQGDMLKSQGPAHTENKGTAKEEGTGMVEGEAVFSSGGTS